MGYICSVFIKTYAKNILTHTIVNFNIMITKEVIQTLYRKYNKKPKSPDFLDMPLLFDYAAEHHNIQIDMDGPVEALVINSIEKSSPFHRIPLDRIHAIVPFEQWIAVVLHASIIFLNRKSSQVSINIRMKDPSLFERIRGVFS